MRRQRRAGRNPGIGGRSEDGRRRPRGRHRTHGHRRTTERRRTNARRRPTDRRLRCRSRGRRRSGRARPRRRRSGGRRRRAVRAAAFALVAIGASIPPAAGLAAVAIAGLGDGGGKTGAAGGSDALAAGAGWGVVEPTAAFPIWAAGGEWSLLVATLLVVGGWVASAATAVRVAARMAALRG